MYHIHCFVVAVSTCWLVCIVATCSGKGAWVGSGIPPGPLDRARAEQDAADSCRHQVRRNRLIATAPHRAHTWPARVSPLSITTSFFCVSCRRNHRFWCESPKIRKPQKVPRTKASPAIICSPQYGQVGFMGFSCFFFRFSFSTWLEPPRSCPFHGSGNPRVPFAHDTHRRMEI